MPELPEVETVARQLDPLLRGKRVVVCRTHDPKLRFAADALAGARVKRGYRLGKFVVLELDFEGFGSKFLAVHLRMTGRLLWTLTAKERAEKKYLRAELELNGGTLLFCDARRFGTMKLYVSESEIPVSGIDPTTPALSPSVLANLLRGRRQPMKHWLLRQDVITGIGNIYASEILFRAGISPRRLAEKVRPSEFGPLYRSIKNVLSGAIKNCGTTFSDFQDASGESGGFERFLRVYGRAGKPCRICKTPIKRIVQSGRSTFYCPKCQR